MANSKRKKVRQSIRAALKLSCAIAALGSSAFAAQGPGLGNLTYNSSEVFTQVSTPTIDDTTGFLPPDYPGAKHYGVNVATMLNGYMLGVFAPDSGGGPGGWIALDVSNPRSIQLIKQVYEPDTTNQHRTGDAMRTAEFREPHSFGLAEGNLIAIQSGVGIEIWDWSDVQNPIQVSKLSLAGANFGDYNNVSWQLFWQAPYLYVARGNGGLSIVDTSDVNNPSLIKTLPKSQLGGFNVGPIFALGNEMYISSFEGTSGFSILDISDPENPTLAKNVSSLPYKYYASCWDGQYAAFSARAAGEPLVIYDTTTTPMTKVHEQLTGFVNLYCNFQDDKLLLGNQEDINVLNVSDITNPFVVGTASLNATGSDVDHGQVFAFGNLIWVGNDHGTGSGWIAQSSTPDVQPATINRAYPADLQANLPTSTRIGIALSDSVLMESVNDQTFKVTKLGSTAPLAGSYSVNLGFVHFTPDSPLETDTIYLVDVNGIQDFSGNVTPATSYRFSTGSTAGHNISTTLTSYAEPNQSLAMSATAAPIVNSAVEYAWDFGDGTTTAFSTNSAVTHSYSEPGHYSVIVTVREQGLLTTKSEPVTIHNAVTAQSPTNSSTIVNDGSSVFVVNEDNDTVSSLQGSAPYTKAWEVSVGDRPRTLTLVGNNELWVAEQGSDSIKILNKANGSLVDSINLDRGSQPIGITVTPDGSNVLVTLSATGELVKFNSSNRQETGRLFLAEDIRAIAVSSDSATALVNRFVSSQQEAEVFEVALSAMTLTTPIVLSKDTTTVDGPDRSRGIFNYLSGITIAPDGQTAWVSANKANVDRGEYLEGSASNALTFETTIRAATTQIDLSNSVELKTKRLDIDNRAQPTAVAFSQFGDYVYIAIEGQNAVEIRDAYSRNRSGELQNTGLAPRGLTKIGNSLFVHNFMSRDVSVYDVTEFESGSGVASQLASIDLVENETMHPRVLAGKQIFYNAGDDRMSADGYISCASCHAGGDSDNRVWDFTDRGEGLRNTISLVGRAGTMLGDVHWTANFDEIHDFENDIRSGFGGQGFLPDVLFNQVSDPLGSKKEGLSDALDDLAFYVSSLSEFPKSPYRNNDGSLTSDALAGQALFTNKGCASCHSGDFYTDQQRHDVGTIQASSGQGISAPLQGVGFKTPTLIGLSSTAPYFHNGQAATLVDVLQTGTEHSVQDLTERAQIVAYLEQIEYEGAPVVTPTPPPANQYDYLSDLTELSSTNGWGPIEKDQSNGEQAAGDGRTQSIGGTQFEKGIGVHAVSEVEYDLTSQEYNRFEAFVGIDDEVGGGSVQFEVYVDNVLSYQSPVLTGSDVATPVFVSIPTNASTLRLVANDGGNGVGEDHANWSDAKLRYPGVQTAAQPGLYYGELNGAINTSDANPQTSVSVNLSETESSIATNTTRVFSGYIYDADGNISFSEDIDDHARIWINDVLVLTDDSWNSPTNTGNLQLPGGWHKIEIRIGNANGPGGAAGPIGIGFDPAGGTSWQHLEDDGTGSVLKTSLVQPQPNYEFVSDLTETSSTNGWGPVEKDRSNGETGATDGNPITIGGQVYAKGLGVHATSSVTYDFAAGLYDQFSAVIGVDDEVNNNGSVVFVVEVDGAAAYTSSTLTGSDSGISINVSIPSNATSLKLIVNDAGNGNGYDHADWGDAKLRLM